MAVQAFFHSVAAASAPCEPACHKLVEFAQNPRLRAIVEGQADWIYRARLYTDRLRPKPTRSIDEHTAIVAAMRASSVDATQAMMEAHRHRAREEILEALRMIEGGA